ncbi:MAG: YggT family protein [Chloroflexi bacterium]|nr:YggT family protein [Chloroflexota bacterium]
MVAIIYEITEPILGPIRSVLPNFGMIDLSPMVALLLMGLIRQILVSAPA